MTARDIAAEELAALGYYLEGYEHEGHKLTIKFKRHPIEIRSWFSRTMTNGKPPDRAMFKAIAQQIHSRMKPDDPALY